MNPSPFAVSISGRFVRSFAVSPAYSAKPACHAQIEAEAIYTAGRLIFLGERLLPNSMTTTLWRVLGHGSIPMIGAISCHPKYRPPEFEAETPLRSHAKARNQIYLTKQ